MKAPALLLLSATGFFALLGPAVGQNAPAMGPDSLAYPAKETIAGTILDEMNNPLAGVTVKFAGGLISKMCITNGRGRYLLEVPRTGGTLAVSFAGYVSQEIAFRKVNELDVVLQPEPGFHRTRKMRVLYRRMNRPENE
ncbi:carboxypeptidase-like regulatory domain-containing protein [Hymenobacter sp. DG01]|uniref:carboxypeptidase-like regulatory domain-containing protein n=1 Tax=Hymenobacter sp. DG01 TaxID=2584940 RepID=UPI00111CF629|nr:carboxypeptidase-like regulatory domain-containing protein [Hymenobacter sp. DG01]